MSKTRELVTGDKKPPPYILELLQNPAFCAKIAASWGEIKTLMLEIQSNLAGYTTAEALQAGPTVLAANTIFKTFRVFYDQAVLDRKNAEADKK